MSNEIVTRISEGFTPSEIMVRLEEFQYSIEQAFNHIDTINNVRDVLLTYRNNISKEAIQIANNTLLSLYQVTGISPSYNITALESSDPNLTVTYVLEGLGDFLRSIWEAICNTFARFWNWIKSLFGSSGGGGGGSSSRAAVSSAKQERKSVVIDKEMKELKDLLKGSPTPKDHVDEFLKTGTTFLSFAWMDDTSLKSLLNNIDDLDHSQNFFSDLLKETSKLVKEFTRCMNDSKSKLLAGDSDPLEKAEELLIEYSKNQAAFIKSYKPKRLDLRHDQDLIKKAQDQMTRSDIPSSVISGFTHGRGLVFFYSHKYLSLGSEAADPSKSNYIYFKSTITSSVYPEKHKGIAYLSMNELETLKDHAKKLKEKTKTYTKDVQHYITEIENDGKAFNSLMKDLIADLGDPGLISGYGNKVADKDLTTHAIAKLVRYFMDDIIHCVLPVSNITISYNDTALAYLNLVDTNINYRMKKVGLKVDKSGTIIV